ncbi:MAG TPA: UDP-3-O-acyl-N-acetylglucosamine deacetylase [Deltaproteobacteria bacterium]|nr:UDP-3-O-acyl-N-acetylglucosamine deacetylase [Deltaproteobacteria bacterium]HPP79296.1 UDP-3-O-acyl-N-acetylglucosamine deacetylase [Deltaproteobacteria bacterium]
MDRTTIAREVEVEGVGLHSGLGTRLRMKPSERGIAFIKDGTRIPATPPHIVDTRLNTTYGVGNVRVGTTEHLMAALYGLGLTDLDIVVEGDEIPAMDGSALPFVEALGDAGRSPLGVAAAEISPRGVLRFGDGASWIEARPGDFSVSYEIDFPDTAIGRMRFTFDGRGFAERIAPARTFGRMQDVEAMRAAGLALGGGLHNAVVVDGDGVVNPEGLRFEDEFVRHKILDLLGDLWSLQAPLKARITAWKASHALHVRLAKALFEEHRGERA